MNTAQKKSFMMAAEILSFTAAAEKLYISQPVMSRNIAALEEEFGFLLFSRQNNVISLTAAGEIMYRWMKESDLSFQEALSRAQDAAKAPAGYFRIGIVKTELTTPRVTRAILAFQHEYPQTEYSILHYSAREIVLSLLKQNIDIAAMLDTEITSDPRLFRYKSGDCRQVLAVPASHPLAEYDPISLRAFSNEVFISVHSEYSPGMSQRLSQICGLLGFVPQIREVSSAEEQLAMILNCYICKLIFD